MANKCAEPTCKKPGKYFMLRPVRGYYCPDHQKLHADRNELLAETKEREDRNFMNFVRQGFERANR